MRRKNETPKSLADLVSLVRKTPPRNLKVTSSNAIELRIFYCRLGSYTVGTEQHHIFVALGLAKDNMLHKLVAFRGTYENFDSLNSLGPSVCLRIHNAMITGNEIKLLKASTFEVISDSNVDINMIKKIGLSEAIACNNNLSVVATVAKISQLRPGRRDNVVWVCCGNCGHQVCDLCHDAPPSIEGCFSATITDEVSHELRVFLTARNLQEVFSKDIEGVARIICDEDSLNNMDQVFDRNQEFIFFLSPKKGGHRVEHLLRLD
jgi:hypothetical protein